MNVNLATLPLPPLTQAAATPQRLRQLDGPAPGRAVRQRFQAAAAAPQGNASASSAETVTNAAHAQARHGLGSYLPAAAPALFRVC